MSTKIGHFEILSELAKSPIGAVYKANDPKSSQTVALKAIQLSAFGEYAAELEKALLEEAETSKSLSHPNVAPMYGAGEIDGQFCAAMEYIQGNSIATMLARKEGFSIWDLLDIGRQVCAGLDNAHSKRVFHYSLEPAKIMCGWDGTVKILGFGMSSVGKFTLGMAGGIPSILHYMSPEQIRGENIDARSNLFSLGAMFYEMVTDRKAFDREDAETLRQSISESTPVPPMHVNPKLHPQLSDLIMKALSKDPAQRYQSGRQLLDDLEKCKESKPQAAKKAAEAPKGLSVSDKVKVAAQAKFAAPSKAPAPKPASAVSAASRPAQAAPRAVAPVKKAPAAPAASKSRDTVKAETSPKAAAAAAGWSGSDAASSVVSSEPPKFDTSNEFVVSRAKATVDAASEQEEESMSAASAEPEIEAPEPEAPRFAVDPTMAEGGNEASEGGGTSFSEISELPPLKEVYVEPPPPPPIFEPQPSGVSVLKKSAKKEKPRVQPREVAEKAIKEIKSVPPKLMMYSIVSAIALILVIAIGVGIHIYSLGKDDDSTHLTQSEPAPAAETAQPSQEQAAPAPPVGTTPALAPAEAQPPAPAPTEPEPAPVRAASPTPRGKNGRKKPAPAPVVIPGQMVIDSTPQGAQVQVDGKADPAWVTPFALSGLAPGQHTVTTSRAGYATDTRAVNVTSANKSFVTVHLAQLMATLSVASSPAGANVYIDGKATGKVTPAQVSVEKGQHVVLVRKPGYIDETTAPQFVLGQTISFSPTLRALGSVDDIKTVGKMKKLFGGGGAQGMGTVSIKTQPKGAQVAVNEHMLEKGSPVEFMLNPGNYVVDITLSGYAPIHRIITVDKAGKVVIDEAMQKQ